MKGLRLTVYRAAGSYPDCSNGGVSSKADVLTVVGRLVDGVVIPLPKGCCVFSPSDEAPAVVLVESRIARFDPTPHLIPLESVRSRWPDGRRQLRRKLRQPLVRSGQALRRQAAPRRGGNPRPHRNLQRLSVAEQIGRHSGNAQAGLQRQHV